MAPAGRAKLAAQPVALGKNPENLTEGEQARMEQLNQENLCTSKSVSDALCLQDIYRWRV